MENLSLYEIIGGVAFLILIGAHPLAILVLRRGAAEINPDKAQSPAATGPVPPHAIERYEDECRTLRSRYLRDLLRPAR